MAHLRVREALSRLRPLDSQQRDELFWIANGQAAQQESFDQSEDAGVRTNAKREREDRCCREGRRLAQRPDCVTEILSHAVQNRFPTDVANLIFHGCDAAQFHSCSAKGLVPAQSSSDLLFGGTLQELDEFSVQFLFQPRPPKQASKSGHDALEEGHHNSPSEASRILATAVVCTCQSRVSRLRWARPCVLSV